MADSENSVSERMRADWNQRAREDAHYYVAFGGRDQDEEGFDATAADVLPSFEFELKRFPKSQPPGLASARDRLRPRPPDEAAQPPLRRDPRRRRLR
jgi:hypothetical protein